MSETDWPPTAAAPSVSVTSEPESATPLTAVESPPRETVNALEAGTEVASASSKCTVSVLALSSAPVACGGVPLTLADLYSLRICSDACVELLDVRGDKREIVRVTRAGCEVCNGSNNQRAMAECISALRRKKMLKIVIVGGSPGQRNDVRQYFEGAGVDIRFVDGTSASHGAKEAERNKMWAQLIVIWGPTPLRHAVSNRYTEERYEGLKVVTVPRRGIEALCTEVVRAAGG